MTFTVRVPPVTVLVPEELQANDAAAKAFAAEVWKAYARRTEEAILAYAGPPPGVVIERA